MATGWSTIAPPGYAPGENYGPPAPAPTSAGVQYAERVDESVAVARPQIVPGWRGRARRFLHYVDPLTEAPLGGVAQVNQGYRFRYWPQRVKTFVPPVPQLNLTVAPDPGTWKFRAQPVQDVNAGSCS